MEEINLLKKFSNPHIIRFIEAFENPGEVILIIDNTNTNTNTNTNVNTDTNSNTGDPDHGVLGWRRAV